MYSLAEKIDGWFKSRRDRKLAKQRAKVRQKFIDLFEFDPIRNREEMEDYLAILQGELPKNRLICSILKKGERVEADDYHTNGLSGGLYHTFPSHIGTTITDNHMPHFRVISHKQIPSHFNLNWLYIQLDKLEKEKAMNSVKQKILKIAGEHNWDADVDDVIEQVGENPKFKEDLGFDSLDEVEFLMDIEDEFNISIPDEDASEIEDVDQLIKYLEENHDISDD